MVAWSEKVQVQINNCNDFCIELQATVVDENEKCWITFVHASTDAKEKKAQWEELEEKRKGWGDN